GYLRTWVTQVLVIRGEWGDLRLEPKLVPEQFGKSSQIVAQVGFAGKRINVTYFNRGKKPYGKYRVESILLHGRSLQPPVSDIAEALILRSELKAISAPVIDITIS